MNSNPNVPEFIQRYQVPFPVGVGDDQKARDFMQFTMVAPAFVPWLVFIDRQGIIRAQFTGNDPFFNGGVPAVKSEVDKLLLEKAPPAAKKAVPAKKK